MKLRLQGNSLRLRLTRSEVVRLNGHGSVEEAASFGSGGSLIYRIQGRPAPSHSTPTSVAGQLPYLYQPRLCGFGRPATKLDCMRKTVP